MITSSFHCLLFRWWSRHFSSVSVVGIFINLTLFPHSIFEVLKIGKSIENYIIIPFHYIFEIQVKSVLCAHCSTHVLTKNEKWIPIFIAIIRLLSLKKYWGINKQHFLLGKKNRENSEFVFFFIFHENMWWAAHK